MQKLLQQKQKKNNNSALIQIEFVTSQQQSKIENIKNSKINVNNPSVSRNGNHAHIVIGPRNVGKIFYMLKIVEKIGNKKTCSYCSQIT